MTRAPQKPRKRGEIPLLLAMTFRRMTDHVHARLAEEGREPLRPAHGFTFRFLADRDDATVVDLAAHLGVTKQAASQIVTELEDWGYVERRAHPTDGRARAIALTRRGRAYIELATALWGEVEDRWAQVIGPRRLQQIHDDLAAYVAGAGEGTPPPLRPVW
ncbi:MAG: MarR family winged helix-turn-helix transcriptional regulator [Byssovorax sp.]